MKKVKNIKTRLNKTDKNKTENELILLLTSEKIILKANTPLFKFIQRFEI